MKSTNPVIQFLYFDGCPLAPRARDNLNGAIAQVGESVRVDLEEVDLLAPEVPADLKRWGSPTILINGKDMMDGEKGSACNCRIYAGKDGLPSAEEIARAIKSGFE